MVLNQAEISYKLEFLETCLTLLFSDCSTNFLPLDVTVTPKVTYYSSNDLMRSCEFQSVVFTLTCLTSGAALLAHPGEDASGDIIVVSAPRCTLLRATEELGLCKTYSNDNMEAFSYNDRDNFKDSGI